MVKLTTFVLGMVIFSVVMTMLFSVVDQYTFENNVQRDGEENDWLVLSGNYVSLSDQLSGDNSTIREIRRQSELGASGSEATDARLLSGSISAGRLLVNFFTNSDKVVDKVTGDLNEGNDAIIDPNIITAIKAIAIIVLILIGLHFIRGFKTET